MKAAPLLSLLLLALLPAAPLSVAEEVCTCADARLVNGWCETHEKGYLASIEIPSKRLFEALDAHGHEVDPDSFKCETCRHALETDGFCEDHRIGFLNGQAYFSRLTHVLSSGSITPIGEIDCPLCRANAEGHGWCDAHGIGMIGNVAIEDREAYEHAVESMRILHEAIRAAGRCEYCAVAIQTDTTCPRCRIRYRNGEPVDAPGENR